MAGFVLAMISAVAGVAGAYFAYLAVDQRFRHRRRRAALVSAGGTRYDVFVSYAEADARWAQDLAAGLRRHGLSVFLAAWISPGLVVLLEKEKALLESAHGVLVFSRATMAQPAVAEEYVVLLSQAHSRGGRFIPVVIDDVVLPPFAAIRQPLDFRPVSGPAYDGKVAELARAVRMRAGASR
ncbi:MAG: toll/interleukin-1 receptor domain-containing protein [Streptosporangiaceae bacterium]|nr:toll/interleukin-1 receptor domain-containing protein [Streptosporangiaceae bacterium]